MAFDTNPEFSTLAALASTHTPRPVVAGEVIFREGDPGDRLYGVVSGEIQLRTADQAMETIGPGSTFGAGALVDPEHRRWGSAVALTDASLLELDREQLLFAMQELPMFGLEVLHDLEVRLQRLKSGMVEI